jgi:hypothetical protein
MLALIFDDASVAAGEALGFCAVIDRDWLKP